MNQPISSDREARREALESQGVLDTPREQDFDELTSLAAEICGTPIAVISFFDGDRHWFKSAIGTDLTEIPTQTSFCRLVMETGEFVHIPDTTLDSRVSESPLVSEAGLKFFAGAPIATENGTTIGALCVADTQPHLLTDFQLRALKTLSSQVIAQLVLRSEILRHEKLEVKLKEQAAILEKAKDAIIVLDLDHRVIQWNCGAEKLYGWTAEEVLGRKITDLVCNDPSMFELASELTATNGEWVGEIVQRSKDGREIIVEGRWTLIRNSDGKPESILKINSDISERRHAEEKLRLLEMCVSRLNDVVIITEAEPIDEPGPKIVFVNEAFERRTGYSAEEVIGKNPRFLQGPKTDRNSLDRIRQAMENWEPIREQVLNYKKTGEEVWLEMEIVPVPDETGWFTHFVSIERDVTSRREAEEALKQNQALVQMASRIGKMGAWSIDLPDLRHTWSEQTREIHEVEEGFEASVLDLIKFYAPEAREQIHGAFAKCIEQGISFDEELPFVTAKGKRIWVRAVGEAVRDSRGFIIRVQGALQDITDRIMAESSLEASENRFRELAESMPMIVWTSTPTGQLDFANHHFWDYTGADPTLPTEELWPSILHPDEEPHRLKEWMECLTSGVRYEAELRARRHDGEYRWFVAQLVPVRNADDQIIKWYGTAIDVQEMKSLQEQAVQLADSLTTTMESITDGFLTLDRDWNFRYVNPEAGRLLLHAPKELIGRNAWEMFPEAEGSPIEINYRRAVETNESVSFDMYYAPLDKWLDIHAYPSVEGIAVHFRDITEQRIAAIKLHEQASLLLNAQRIGRMGSWIMEIPSGHLEWSDATCDLFGVESSEFGKTMEDFLQLVHPDDREALQAAIIRQSLSNRGIENEYRIIRPDGQVRWMFERGTVDFDEAGNPMRRLGMVMDITEQYLAEQALQRANEALEERVAERTAELERTNYELLLAKNAADAANMAKSEFLSRMSHELRTPMNAILGFGQLLEFSDLSEDNRDFVSHIMKAGRHLLALINDILEISRVEIGETGLSLEPVNTVEIVKESMSLMRTIADDSNVSLVLEPSPRIFVRSDHQKLRQVVLNIVSNGIKYNKPGGSLNIRIEEVDDSHVEINFRDSGIGISEADLKRLFTPFLRLKASGTVEGTGLGLALSRSLIEAMGGTLTSESVEGEGSVFKVRLQRASEMDAALELEMKAPDAPASLDTMPVKILVIEDNLTNVNLLERVFSDRRNCELLVAMQGTLGLDLAREHHPDVVLLDLHLPDMKGQDVLAAIKNDPALANTPVIMVTADAYGERASALLAAGAFRFMTKPFDIGQLIQAVDDALSLKGES